MIQCAWCNLASLASQPYCSCFRWAGRQREKYVWTLWTAFCAIRRNVVVWYYAYTSSISVELVECNTYDVNFINLAHAGARF